MRQYFILRLGFFLNFLSQLCAGQSQANDTVFLLKQEPGQERHVIYIEENRNSVYYKRIANFCFGRFDSLNYAQGVEYLESKHISFQKPYIPPFPRKWCPLYIYNNKFFGFTPTGFGNNAGCLMISDSSWISFGGEGPHPNPINSFTILPDHTYRINLTDDDSTQPDIFIQWIDEQRGIARFGDRLMVEADKLKLFPLIVEDEGGTRFMYAEGDYPVKFEEPTPERLARMKQ
jgi:hypothetical protein